MKGETALIGDLDFNRDDDQKQFGCQRRIVNMARYEMEEIEVISLSFELGRKEDDVMTIILSLNEFLIALGRLEI